jgi:SLOG family YspA-like protein
VKLRLQVWLEGSFHQGGTGKRQRRPSELSGDRARSHAFRAPNIYSDTGKWPGARKMRVLVCGGRDFDDVGLMISVLDRLHTEKSFTVLIHGNARGADRIADAWAWRMGVPCESYGLPQGEWDELGKKAGPLRNQRMLDEGKPDLVVAFPGSGGTKDMVRRAVKAGVAIHEVNRADDW